MSNKKRSRTGKKKKSVYLEQKKVAKSGKRVTEAERKALKRGRNAHFLSLGLLVLAMVGIFSAPGLGEGTPAYIGLMLASYGATLAAGLLMSTIGTGNEVKARGTNRIIGLLMVLLGLFGLLQIGVTHLM